MDNSTAIKEGFIGQKLLIIPNNIISKIRSMPLANFLYVTDIGYFPNAKHHQRQRQKGSNQYILIYCVEGKGWIKIHKKLHHVSPNQFIIIPKDTPHKYGADQDIPWSIYWMHFDGTMAGNMYNKYSNSSPSAAVTVPFIDERLSLFKQIIDILNSGFNEEKIQYASLTSLNFLSTFIFSDLHITTDPQANDSLVDEIIHYLNENIHKSVNTDEIVDKFNYSPSYLFSLFKKKTGYSIIHFFNLMKIQKACEYLTFSDLSVKEICYKMGFQDPLYFSRLFKKYMGVAPTDYRKELIS